MADDLDRARAGDARALARLISLVEDGDFLEGLFFRLNVVCLEAQSTEDGHYHEVLSYES